MATVKMITLMCDACFITADSSAHRADVARRDAKAAGWACSKNRDLCPDCKKGN